MATTRTQQSPRDRHERAKDEAHPVAHLIEHFREYARNKPESTALWCLGIGFVLGWKLKPW